MEIVGGLAGGFAHDFDNLLIAILAYPQLGLAKLDSTEDRLYGHCREISKTAERAARLTQALPIITRG